VRAHALVIANVIRELSTRLERCAVFSADLKVLVQANAWYAYPDLTVACDEEHYREHKKFTLLNPTFLVEVLSPTTRQFDRCDKAVAYRNIPSIKGVLLLEPEDVWIECWQRTADGWRSNVITDPGAVLKIDVLGCEVPVAEIYRGV
jgi:Uma2 family endonuclease